MPITGRSGKAPLEKWHKDKAGNEAPTDLENGTYFHPGTSKLYTTGGAIFDAERGRWMIAYRSRDCDVFFAHLPEDFTRIEANGLPRFIKVENECIS